VNCVIIETAGGKDVDSMVRGACGKPGVKKALRESATEMPGEMI
jgi:hypothetical protein